MWSLPAYLGRRAIAKQRFVKRYRLPALDTKLTQRRLVGEARGLCKVRACAASDGNCGQPPA